MSSKGTIKFRYRIIIGKNADYPYIIKKKWLCFWFECDKEKTMEMAKETIRKLVQRDMMRPGKVVFEYTHEDLLTETLKGHR